MDVTNAPLVVVPAHELEELLVQLDAAAGCMCSIPSDAFGDEKV
jgi:hypothetical protein